MNMSAFNLSISILAALMIFLFSLRGFSKELKDLGAEKLQLWLGRITKNRFKGFLMGALITAIIQSSSAVSSIIVALVDAGVISFYNSLGILIGSNVGTTFTAWLVAFKLDNLGSYLIVLGTLVSFVPYRIHLAGKSIFYLGLILFSLQQISLAITPLNENTLFIQWLSYSDHILIGVVAGAIITAILQSSSVVTGLIIILAYQNLISLQGAIAVVIGTNLGTTTTALLASINFTSTAKKTARANAFFNTIGVLLFLPILPLFTRFISHLSIALPYQIATAHLIFNLVVAILFLMLIKQIHRLFNHNEISPPIDTG